MLLPRPQLFNYQDKTIFYSATVRTTSRARSGSKDVDKDPPNYQKTTVSFIVKHIE